MTPETHPVVIRLSLSNIWYILTVLAGLLASTMYATHEFTTLVIDRIDQGERDRVFILKRVDDVETKLDALIKSEGSR